MICTALCVGELIVPPLPTSCGEPTPRDEKKAKLILWRCDIAIPTGDDDAIATALVDLLAAGTIGSTGLLRNFLFADPQTTDQSFADCRVAKPIYTQRDLTFEDYNAFDKDDSGNPAPYYDRTIWRAINAGQKWNFGYTTCDGKMYLFTDADGIFFDASFTVFKSEDRSTANKIYEVKKGTVRFLGDPEQSFPVPFLDLETMIATHPELSVLYS